MSVWFFFFLSAHHQGSKKKNLNKQEMCKYLRFIVQRMKERVRTACTFTPGCFCCCCHQTQLWKSSLQDLHVTNPFSSCFVTVVTHIQLWVLTLRFFNNKTSICARNSCEPKSHASGCSECFVSSQARAALAVTSEAPPT